MSIKLKINYSVRYITFDSNNIDSNNIENTEYTEYVIPNPKWVEQYIGENDRVNIYQNGWENTFIKKYDSIDYNNYKELHIPIFAKLVRTDLKKELINLHKKKNNTKIKASLGKTKKKMSTLKTDLENYHNNKHFIKKGRPTNLGPISFII